ncbi:MAG: TerB family tellurite resistance protein [Bacteroidia bacterium]|nr:TerB family tellurite resistance protein [Bacteroidia bacterium]MDW8157475.1 TerB family tellurite resistance protein [Bacteroidia bacterium]
MALSSGETSLKNYPIAERISYLSLLATLAAADGIAEAEEIENLTKLCQAACLGEETTNNILKIAQGQSELDFNANIELLKKSELRFTFILDTILLAHADGEVEEKETQEIQKFSELLEIQASQLSVLHSFAKDLHEAKVRNATPEELEALGKKYAEIFEVSKMDAKALFLGGIGYGFSSIMSGITKGVGVAVDYVTTGLKATYRGVKSLWNKLTSKQG